MASLGAGEETGPLVWNRASLAVLFAAWPGFELPWYVCDCHNV
jgi:hypothetical protein